LKLSEIFLAHAPASAGRALASRELENALQDLVARGSRAWPELAVKPEELVRHAARDLQSSDPSNATVVARELHAEDLHLACACALNTRGALEAFERTYLGSHLARVLSRFAPSAGFVDEVRQSLREKLFVRKRDEAPIAKYSGHGPLAHWVRVTALRTALDLQRRRIHSSAMKQETEIASAAPPELHYLKHRYGKEFQKAISAAFSSLDDKQCNLLRLQHVDGLRTAQIAALFHVDRSTVKRQLASCRAQLLDQTRRILRERLGMSPSEFESLGVLVQSQLHLSMERLLKRRDSVRNRVAGFASKQDPS
jgi:RNA polymerase sigma-70 factor (ECF subfamily)